MSRNAEERGIQTEEAAHSLLQISFSFKGTNKSGRGTGYNISLGGCSVESSTEMPVGALLELHIRLSGVPESSRIETAAVRWTSHHRFGVEFLSIWPGEKERLKQLIAVFRYGVRLE